MGDSLGGQVNRQQQLRRQTKLVEQSQNQAALLRDQNNLIAMQNELLAAQCRTLDWIAQATWRMEMRQLHGPTWKAPSTTPVPPLP